MERKLGGVPVMIMTIILAGLGFFLRHTQLQTAFDAIGVIPGSKMTLIWVSVFVVLLFVAMSFLLRNRKKYQSLASTRPLPLAGGCAAGILLAVDSVLLLIANSQKVDLVIGLGGVAAAACWIGVSVLRYRGAKAHAALYLVPVVFFVVELVCRFRFWTRDPVILDYCFDLLALISSMCGLLHLSAYCFDQGARRITVFFALCGIYFSAGAMAGASAEMLLGYLAAAIWLLVQLWLLLRPMPRKSRGEEE